MSSLFNSVRCLECGHTMEAKLFPGACPNCGGSWLNAEYDLSAIPENWAQLVKERTTDLWRFKELLPHPEGIRNYSMGEGFTPLTRAEGLEKEFGHPEIWIKDERQHPTGSFKDRQAASAVTALKAEGINELVIASTGNAAAAYAAYCSRADIKLWVFLTSMVPAEKMRELALYGAEVIKITGTYDQAKKIAHDFATRRGIHYDLGAKAIPDKEVMKTMAFEIVEQLGWRAPDWYIQAVSGGLGPLGVHKGFEELYQAGLIDRVPKMGIVQVEGCAPMVHAWEQGLNEAEPVTPDTLITVLSTGNPGYAYTILKQANDKYGGAMVSVGDGDAFRAMRKLARTEGFSVEPATSVAFAGMEKLIKAGYIGQNESIVINCSGHTFSTEKHVLEDRYFVDLDINTAVQAPSQDGLQAALERLDEQVTSIVIIDDNQSDRRLVKRLLAKYKNYRIFEANNGHDGIDLVRQRLPELVILDLTLPEMDGFTILEALKRDDRTKDIPVVIVSGKDLSPDQKAVLDHQAETVMLKGNFSGQDLINNVLGMLGDEIAAPVSEESPDIGTTLLQNQVEKTVQFGKAKAPKILIVDDNYWDARLMRRLLELKLRSEVSEVNTAGAAWNEIKFNTPDLIFLDLLLPDSSGEELLTQIRQNPATAHIPVIIVSGKDLDRSEFDELKINANSIWSKAMMDRKSLLNHIEELLS